MIDVNAITSGFSWETAYVTLRPLFFFLMGMVLYSIFIYKMYRFVASRDLFGKKGRYQSIRDRIDTGKGSIKRAVLRFLEYIFLFPFLVFIFFAFFFIMLVFLSKNPNVENLMLVAMAIVGAVRISSYYSEDLSRDLAKMLPFAVLGLYITEIYPFSFSNSIDAVLIALNNTSLWVMLLYYLIFIILLEFSMRVLYLIYSKLSSGYEIPES
ncbi:hypothetical protein DRN74_02605 [Candidatus Micrarchaeota archaeon]|nr:MAG: hypothetical protein DRN74_02605 [Candidatus Micrarchaeota archaeon]